MDAPVMYVVRFWVDPQGHREVFDWLDGGHSAEVVAQPGFLFYHRLALEQPGDDGWPGYMMLYGLESRQALENYFNNKALHEKFNQQRAPFVHCIRTDRAWGSLEASLGK